MTDSRYPCSDTDHERIRGLLAQSLERLNGYAVLFPSHDTSELARAIFEELEGWQ